jgi:acyl-CoA reductase-like NAD-dependent aldehyde dehydrogenase
MVHEAGMPEGWVQTFLPEEHGLSEAFATDQRVAFLSFIGSARVGWHLRSKLAPGARCALEHGGVAPVIIDRSADLDKIIEPMVKGGYYHAGQACVSVQRIYVHTDPEREFIDRFAERVAALRVGGVNGARNLPIFGEVKFPSLAGGMISRRYDRGLRFSAAGRDV